MLMYKPQFKRDCNDWFCGPGTHLLWNRQALLLHNTSYVPYTQIYSHVYLLRTSFHFHMGTGCARNLSVILQKGEDDRKLLWSRSSSTFTQWVPEHLPVGKQDQPYRVWTQISHTCSDESDLQELQFAVTVIYSKWVS